MNWFFWIGALSIINTILYFADASLSFVIGLGATQFVDGFAGALAKDLGPNYSSIIYLIMIALDIGIAGIFITAGLLGNKRYRWAVIAGMVLYILDGLIFVIFGGILEILFHLLALWYLWTGLRAMNKLKALESTPSTSMSTTTKHSCSPGSNLMLSSF